MMKVVTPPVPAIMGKGGFTMKLLLCSAFALLFATSGLAAGPGLDGMDTAVVPGNDFFGYANGGWIKKTEIPADRSSYGSGAILTELNAQRVRELIEQAPHT